MAKLSAPEISGVRISELAPEGEYIATCLAVYDLFGVERQAFQSSEMETKDITRFLFGIYDEEENQYLVQTYEFTISGARGSNLMKFLKNWLGKTPEMGWDYCEMIGEGAYITVENKASRTTGNPYSTIATISPVPKKLLDEVWDESHYADLLEEAENNLGGDDAPKATSGPKGGPKKKAAKKAVKKTARRAPAKPKDEEEDGGLDEDVPF